MSVITSVQNSLFPVSLEQVRLGNLAQPTVPVHLDGRAVYRLDGDHRWHMIVCREGLVWITQERDVRDYVLSAGEIFIVTRRGRVLVQALPEARIEVTPSLEGSPYVGNYVLFP